MTMHQNEDSLGSCPECGEPLFPVHVLIEYETGTGTTHYVDCPNCVTVVQPQHE